MTTNRKLKVFFLHLNGFVEFFQFTPVNRNRSLLDGPLICNVDGWEN
jgi:hypothetical protein